MKQKSKTKFINFTLLFLVLLGIVNCEQDYDLVELKNESEGKRSFSTVSFEQAKGYYAKEEKLRETSLSKNSNSLQLNPNWESLEHEDLFAIDEAKLTSAEVQINRKGKYKSKLIFINVNGEIKNAIYTIFVDKIDSDGTVQNASIFLNELDGKFIDGYKIENRKFIKRYALNPKPKMNKAGFIFFLQDNTEDDPFWCAPPEDGQLDEVSLGTLTRSGGGGNVESVGDTYSIIRDWNLQFEGSGSGSNLGDTYGGGGGSFSSVMGSIHGETVETENASDGECPDGKIEVNGECQCAGEKIQNITTGECECPEGMIENDNGVCEQRPTPCETALLSRDVYSTENGQQEFGTEPIPQELSGGWELNNTLDLSTLTLTHNDSGFNSAVYQKLENGVYQYMYVTEGTDPISIIDWYNNVSQVSGNSEQYEISVHNAQLLDSLVGNNKLYFTGHSLGGGLASVNSLATGRTAFTYNAAGISNSTRNIYDNGLNPQINATVVEGEILDRIQERFGIQAEDSDTINYIEEESSYWENFINERSPALNTYRAVRLHMIETVIEILDCL